MQNEEIDLTGANSFGEVCSTFLGERLFLEEIVLLKSLDFCELECVVAHVYWEGIHKIYVNVLIVFIFDHVEVDHCKVKDGHDGNEAFRKLFPLDAKHIVSFLSEQCHECDLQNDSNE